MKKSTLFNNIFCIQFYNNNLLFRVRFCKEIFPLHFRTATYIFQLVFIIRKFVLQLDGEVVRALQILLDRFKHHIIGCNNLRANVVFNN